MGIRISDENIKHRAALEYASETKVETVDPGTICSNRAELKTFHLDTVKDEELDLRNIPFCLTSSREDGVQVRIDKLVLSFDIGLSANVWFSTACQSTTTHWKQTSLW